MRIFSGHKENKSEAFYRTDNFDGHVVSRQTMTQQSTMPRKRKGSGLARRAAKKKPVVRQENLPSLPVEEVLLPVDDDVQNEECLPNDNFRIVDDKTCSVLQATSDECPTLNAQAKRLAIAHYYIQVLDAPSPEEWDGLDGTVIRIQKCLNFDVEYRRRIRVIISQVYHCHCIGTQYTGERNVTGDLGRKVIIKKTSVEAQIIADAVEDGMSMAMAHALVNKHCFENGQEPFSLSAVRTLILSLDPVVTPLEKTKQGDTDPGSAWARARYNWVLQLLIRFGLFTYLAVPVIPPSPVGTAANSTTSSSNLDFITNVTTTTSTTASTSEG